MLTPRDIHEAEFKRVWKGYSPEEVDTFLSQIVTAYERVFRDNKVLQGKVDQLTDQLEEALKSEGLIADTLQAAREAAEDVKIAARKEAETRLSSAETEAEDMMVRARRKVQAEADRYEDLLERTARLREQVRRVVEEFFYGMHGIAGMDDDDDHNRRDDDSDFSHSTGNLSSSEDSAIGL